MFGTSVAFNELILAREEYRFREALVRILPYVSGIRTGHQVDSSTPLRKSITKSIAASGCSC